MRCPRILTLEGDVHLHTAENEPPSTMPGSLQSYRSFDGDRAPGMDDRREEQQLEHEHERDPIARLRHDEEDETDHNRTPTSPKSSPFFRRSKSARTLDERSSLLGNPDTWRNYNASSIPDTPRHGPITRQGSHIASVRLARNHSRTGSVNQRFSQRLVNALTAARTNNPDQR
jgi:hypothetical protein